MAQLEVGAYLMGPALIDWSANQNETQPAGNRDALSDIVPNEVFGCGDGRFIAISATDNPMWQRLASVIDGLESPAWVGIDQRRSDRAQIYSILSEWCSKQSAQAAMGLLQSRGVAAGVVQNASDLVDDDQHHQRQFWRQADLSQFGPRLYDRFPAIWSQSGDLTPYQPAPSYLGEANFEVWGERVGMDPSDVAVGIGEGLFR